MITKEQFIITYKHRPLSYCFFNGNGRIRDIIGFSFKCYETHKTEKEAVNRIKFMMDRIRQRTDFDLKLSIKLFDIFYKLKIEKVVI